MSPLKTVLRRVVPYPVRRFAACASSDLKSIPARLRRPGGLREPWSVVHSSGGGDFQWRSDRVLTTLEETAGVGAGLVLDVGCGGGALADALARRWAEGEGAYIGFDVSRAAIRQSLRRVGALRRDFRFVWADVRNGEYAPRGAASASAYRFPCEDAAAARVVATSLFTHLSDADAKHYLAEIGRCLAPDGAAVVTFFVLDDEARAAMKAGVAEYDFAHPALGGWTYFPEMPEAAIAHDDANVHAWIAAAGLRVDTMLPGGWRGIAGMRGGQDTLVLRRIL